MYNICTKIVLFDLLLPYRVDGKDEIVEHVYHLNIETQQKCNDLPV